MTKKGILEDSQIDDEKDSAGTEGEKKEYVSQYTSSSGALPEYFMGAGVFPGDDRGRIRSLLSSLDDPLLDRMDLEMGMGNRKLESRMESVRKSRLLMDRVNDALTILKRKPGNGAKMYELIYLTYLAPDKLSHTDLLYRLDISTRHYYRLRQQAITILSIRLWSGTGQ